MLTSIVAALFLPLFPLSIVLNLVLTKLRHPIAQFLLLLAWPQIGVLILDQTQAYIPSWFVAWALLSAGLYALRMLTCRELERHAAYLASSSLALIWVLAAAGAGTPALMAFAFWLSLPAALSMLIAGSLARRFGAAYAGLSTGLGQTLPRLSGVLAITTLAAIATPPFPGFFALLDLLGRLQGSLVMAVLAIWLMWGWSATRLLQGFLTGEPRQEGVGDLAQGSLAIWSALLVILAGAGLYLTGGVL